MRRGSRVMMMLGYFLVACQGAVSKPPAAAPKPVEPSARETKKTPEPTALRSPPSLPHAPAARPVAKRVEVVLGDAPTRGPEKALLTIVLWCDFQSPFCEPTVATLEEVRRVYPDRLRVAFKHMPLVEIHERALAAALASEAARLQGKFWQMCDLLIRHHLELEEEDLRRYAESAGLAMSEFDADRQRRELEERIAEDVRQARELAVAGVPAVIFGTQRLQGIPDPDCLREAVEHALERIGSAALTETTEAEEVPVGLDELKALEPALQSDSQKGPSPDR